MIKQIKMDLWTRRHHIERREEEIFDKLDTAMIHDEIHRRNRLRCYHQIPYDRDDLLPDPEETRKKYLERITDDFDLKYRFGKYHPDVMPEWRYSKVKSNHNPLEIGWPDGKPADFDYFRQWHESRGLPVPEQPINPEAEAQPVQQPTNDARNNSVGDLDAEFERMKAEYAELTGEQL